MGNKSSRGHNSRPEQAGPSESRVPEQNYGFPSHKGAQKFSRITDQYKTLDQVIAALREFGLESSNLILGIDFTKSNEWTGKHSFNRRSLHAIGNILNPYEQAISIVGRTLSPFDEDNLIPCFGFGDATTHDHSVFSFFPDFRPCHGFEEALARYKEIVPHLKLAGPTSFAPIIEAAMGIVERTGGQYHVLVIIADGQVTRNSDTPTGAFSAQEQKTIDAIVAASHFPLSIVLVGVGDGPWDAMQNFDDNIPSRVFDNFQFVNFTSIMSKNMTTDEKEAAFALAALMEIPFQYKATQELQLLSRRVGNTPEIQLLPPPLPGFQYDTAMKYNPYSTSYQFQGTPQGGSFQEATSFSTQHPQGTPHEGSVQDEGDRDQRVCPVCLTNPRDMAFGCGHTTCRDCSQNLSTCPICRTPISTRLRLY
uniref:RING-type domain-containing protein n=1 Tax=Araucaria cunninghamii TaxID=56994 RepID=A0A0D6QSE4_ARACU